MFEQIRKVQPRQLYVAADGPRPGNEEDQGKCREARDVVMSMIDWDCEVKTLFRETNLGCKVAVSEGIDWFFSHVEEGIILEDDTFPDLSFFRYCETMLDFYRDSDNVMMISGYNICETWKADKQGYHGSYFGAVWGWATWAKSWKGYDVNIRSWGSDKVKSIMLRTYFKSYETSRMALYDQLYSGQIDTWDLQWTFHRLLNNGLSIVPARNLVKNIGFGDRATHTVDVPSWNIDNIYAFQEFESLGHLEPDQIYDSHHLMKTAAKNKKTLSKVFQRILNPFI